VGKYTGIQEEELKNKVGRDFFSKFDHTDIPGKIDFAVRKRGDDAQAELLGTEYYLWAEAKAKPKEAAAMLAQLVLTIGKARTFDKPGILPPKFLGCFDCDKIAFIEYHEMHEIFSQNDFNWNVTPSDHKTDEFKQVREKILQIHAGKTLVFNFSKDKKLLEEFIRENFKNYDRDTVKIQIDKNNFVRIYYKWLEVVKPSIDGVDWNLAKKYGIIDGYFYLADLLSSKNKTIKEKLFVLLKTDHYETDRHIDNRGMLAFNTADFKDGQKAHAKFWAIYERPPKEEYRDYIVERVDLLVPQDVRERKGSFYTPKKWVELSQKYLADVFGVDWQDEYYIWDCAAGTGNLLAGLINKRNIWASTLDKADVDVMHDRIDNGANLLKDHCFQFDFLNDDFKDLPKKLLDIIKNTPEKLIVYINPPYAEDTNKSNFINTSFKGKVAQNKIHDKYADILKKANHEIFAQFLIRIYKELERCKNANFAKLKALCASNFGSFRETYQAKLKRLFICPADTFDNVNGQFPIGFHIWDTDKKGFFKKIVADVFDRSGDFLCKKTIYNYDDSKYINDWLKPFRNTQNLQDYIGILYYVGNDFQHNNFVTIEYNEKGKTGHYVALNINQGNLIEASIYFTVRKVIPADWLNDRDQFLHPNDGWEADKDFQNDCLTYTLFNNNISSAQGTNHWIPFTEDEVKARDSFDSHFMLSFMTGKIIQNGYSNLFEHVEDKPCIKRVFSPEAKAVFAAGRALWRYYHEQPKCNVNASFYDIREYFQGRNDKGRMNLTSEDEKYNGLIKALRDSLKVLAKKIEPKIYEYGFLRE
jgi:hypothetical protein